MPVARDLSDGDFDPFRGARIQIERDYSWFFVLLAMARDPTPARAAWSGTRARIVPRATPGVCHRGLATFREGCGNLATVASMAQHP